MKLPLTSNDFQVIDADDMPVCATTYRSQASIIAHAVNCVDDYERKFAEMQAVNAKLLAACEAALKRFGEFRWPPEEESRVVMDQLRAAIAAGKGER